MKVDFKKLIRPREDFIRETRARFLALFDTAVSAASGRKPNEAGSTAPRFAVALRALAACGALAAVLVGVSVYADTANVAADSTFYPFKRLSENVRLAFTPLQAKADLRATFATRRAVEIKDLSSRVPSSTLIANLSSDLNTEVDDSVRAARVADLTDGNLDTVCGKILSAIATSSLATRGEFSIHARALLRFEDVCAQGQEGSLVTSTAAAAANLSGIASPVAPSSSPSTELRIRGGGSLNIIFNHEKHQDGDRGNDKNKNKNQDQNNQGDENSGVTSSVTTTTNASATIYVPDVENYVEHQKESDLFNSLNGSVNGSSNDSLSGNVLNSFRDKKHDKTDNNGNRD